MVGEDDSGKAGDGLVTEAFSAQLSASGFVLEAGRATAGALHLGEVFNDQRVTCPRPRGHLGCSFLWLTHTQMNHL